MVDDKFILMGLDDDRAKDIADVLSNKTCKKIIDYLAETKEASEKDIADALGIPINTIEYNLNKLKKAGLVEKAKNFFWSRKGRKIDMYKLAKKHIVISPKSSKPNMKKLKTILPVVLIAAVLIALAGLYFIPREATLGTLGNQTYPTSDKIKQFNSLDELKNFLNKTSGAAMQNFAEKAVGAVAPSGAARSSAADSSSAESYSQTNIQVKGVDEPDIVKNDGKYIYTLSGNKIIIVNAYPADEMKILSEINFSNARNMFINENKLIVFGEEYKYYPYVASSEAAGDVRCLGYGCGGYSESKTKVYIYDISNREKPVLERNMSFDGNYLDSRMINNYIYLVSSKYIYRDNPILPVYEINGIAKSVAINDIYYFDYVDTSYVFTSISSIKINEDKVNSKVYLTGGASELYVSQDNIYLTYRKTMNWNDYYNRQIKEVYLEVVPNELKSKIQEIADSNIPMYEKQNKIYNIIFEYSNSLKGDEKSDFDKKLQDAFTNFSEKIAKENEKTVIHKINVDKNNIDYKGVGEVPGHILNQFSMDEYDGNFRIATTTGEIWGGNSLNHIYVLDDELKIIGSVEDLAKGEKIYSARFIGKRAYLVTFKKIDPFYVIDLSNPNEPKVLGYLKIPGYSDYLHPYDENHVIGIGKEAVDASESETSGRNLDFAWYQGIKIALFDVSDVENPKESGKFVIGDRGTESPALYEHKAFLFDKEKKILVIPVTLAEINRSKYRSCTEEELNSYDSYNYCLTPYTYGEQVWQGAYVLNIDLNEISLRGKITHFEKTPEATEYGWRFFDYRYQIQRSLYMDDVLYTVSNSKIKANDLKTIDEINSLNLGYNEPVVYGEAVM